METNFYGIYLERYDDGGFCLTWGNGNDIPIKSDSADDIEAGVHEILAETQPTI